MATKRDLSSLGWRWTVRVIAGLAVVSLSLALVACGGSSGPSPEEEARLKKQGAARVHKEERLRRLERELKEHIKNGGTTSVPPRNESSLPSVPSTSTRESCGGELEVNSYTTCPFAENVREAYFEEIGSGGGTVLAYSPVTGMLYEMYCSSSPHECTGGNNAAVYFP